VSRCRRIASASTEVIITLDDLGEIVWLTYSGENSGQGGIRLPTGIVEQLTAADPTFLSMKLSQGPPPVRARLTLDEDEARRVEAFEQAEAEGWAMRGRRTSPISR